MSAQRFILSAHSRNKVADAISLAPDGFSVSISEPTRSLVQNARLWAMLTDVAKQVEWYRRMLSEDDWKNIFTAALKKHEVVPGIDGGFVMLGTSTSKMSIKTMCDMQELIAAFGAERGVKFSAGDQGYEEMSR